MILQTQLFYDGQDFCTKLDTLNDFWYGNLHIILKPRNLGICQSVEKIEYS